MAKLMVRQYYAKGYWTWKLDQRIKVSRDH